MKGPEIELVKRKRTEAAMSTQTSVPVYSLSFPKFVLFGDSITERCFSQFPYTTYVNDGFGEPEVSKADQEKAQFAFGAELSHLYRRRMSVIARGFSGYNTEQCRIIIPKILQIEHDASPEGSKVELCTVFLGSNDAASAYPDKVEYTRYLENMEFIIDEIRKRKIRPIIVGPTLYDRERYERLDAVELAKGIYRTSQMNKKYSEGLKALCARMGVPFVDLYSAFEKLVNEGSETMTTLLLDGIHFAGPGNKVLYEELEKVIKKYYPEWHPSHASFGERLPQWGDVELKKLDEILVR
ncbi:unnamed protein product [Kuraishia capsulata CBS 1993]|uniref:SGNH hydrolase-type esterase domain-containing protein n=1 Tax=Kuraishia capsulata CBS 1993 TaxID=1382522 RepID=W6MXF8_9ASCO|nr:uncharacterized protein KUCA_T00004800001 [Kuraishia capsulata CBS 1993]CDK28815.1 unnamed protein product [Kuraishia capsulata CBS 1993]